jgi:hypothetical protein
MPCLVLVVLLGCGGSGESATSAEEERSELADGTYSCSVYNETTGHGPYDLSCTKSGDNVTAYFSNGGYVEGVSSGEDGPPWIFEGSDSRGNTWQITIDE